MNVPTANWSYPTAIKFGPGRIRELADHCKAVGMKKPLLVTDKALAALPRTPSPSGAETALDGAILTAPDARDPGLMARLDAVAGRALAR